MGEDLKLTLSEIEDLEREGDFSFLDLLVKLDNKEYPKVTLMRKIVAKKGVDTEDITTIINKFTEIIRETTGKK